MKRNEFQEIEEFMSMRTVVNTNQHRSRMPLLVLTGAVLIVGIVAGVCTFAGKDKGTVENATPVDTHTNEITTIDQTNRTRAEKRTEEIIGAFQRGNFTEIKCYLYPAILQMRDGSGADNTIIALKYMAPFYTPEFEFLDYTVKSEQKLEDMTVSDSLKEYSDYIEPSFFTQVEVEVSYEDQRESVNFIYACCDDIYYLYTIKGFGIDFSDYKYSKALKAREANEMFYSNPLTINGEIKGERKYFDGYSLIVPENWTLSAATVSPEITSNNSAVDIQVTGPSALVGYDVEDLLKETADYCCRDYIVTEAGYFEADAGTVYYLGMCDSFGYDKYCSILTYVNEDVACSLLMTKVCRAQIAWEEAMQIAASFQFE